MYFIRVVFVVTMVFSCFSTFGQKKEGNEIKLRLAKVSDFKKNRSMISIPGYVKIWGSETSVDSILWSIPLQKNTNDHFSRANIQPVFPWLKDTTPFLRKRSS